jgi:hypothetical protein
MALDRARAVRATDEAGFDLGQLRNLVTAVARSGDAEVVRFW